MSIYIIIGIIALVGGYLNLKGGNSVGTSGINIVTLLGTIFGIAATIGIIYAFISFGLKDGFLSILSFFIGGAIGASFGKSNPIG